MACSLTIRKPVPFEVTQRQGFQPLRAHEHEPGGPALGHADVPVEIDSPAPDDAEFQYRVGASGDWTQLNGTRSGERFTGPARLPAGGWYRLEVRCTVGGEEIASAAVHPVGVGEVLMIAGQSYAEGCNDELLRVEDPEGRATAYDTVNKTWAVAHDPPPNLSVGGTIWPPMCDALLPLLRVPVGIVNVASGGTASRQWMPGEALYERLADAGEAVRRFRAVLWQQGESDIIEKVPADVYIQNIVTIRERLAERWGFEPPWLLAKSTLHPMVYNDPAGEGVMRDCIDRLWSMPGFRSGPDTDILGGENRGGEGSRCHFTAIGQKRAGLMWFAAVWQLLNAAGCDP